MPLPFLRRRKREIFRYHDGQRERGADPIRVLRLLTAHPTFNAEKHLDLAVAENSDPAALAITLAATREVFGLAEYSDAGGVDSGLTDGEALRVMLAFCGYLGEVKKNTSGPPITPLPMGAAPRGDSITRPSSDCGSTSPAAKPDKPTPS